jgi:mono/diheme cytochrome c family protein
MAHTTPRTKPLEHGRSGLGWSGRWPGLLALATLLALIGTFAWAARSVPATTPVGASGEAAPVLAQDEPSPDFQRATALYNASCVACHGPYGSGAAMPGLGIPPLDAQGTAWQNSAIDLQFIIKGGKGTMPGVGGSWTQQDVRDVLALIRTWWTPEQQKQFDALSMKQP